MRSTPCWLWGCVLVQGRSFAQGSEELVASAVAMLLLLLPLFMLLLLLLLRLGSLGIGCVAK